MINRSQLIAIVGSDGSGKSTVGAALLDWLGEQGPVELCHLGKQSGNLARTISRAPIVGKRAKKRIDHEVDTAGEDRGPGTVAALIIYAFSLRRLRRFRRMLRHRKRGVTILADRFPQLAVPAGIDGPGFARVKLASPLSRRLAAREMRAFEWMTSHRPDLVLRLNVDVDTAIARKPDHDPAALTRKIKEIGNLSFAGAPIVDIDATRPLAEVIAAAKSAIMNSGSGS